MELNFTMKLAKTFGGNMSKCILSNVFVQSNLGKERQNQVPAPRKQGVLVRSMTVQMPSQGIHGNLAAISDSSIF